MRKKALIIIGLTITLLAFKKYNSSNDYIEHYNRGISSLEEKLEELKKVIGSSDLTVEKDLKLITENINNARVSLKEIDIWLRYLEPISYKRINGPLPIEWETEVFEKFEKPYKREGAGLTLATLYLEEEKKNKDSLYNLINSSVKALQTYKRDSIKEHLRSADHFYLCNRLFLLNLATIYTTGFECPETEKVIEELQTMLLSVNKLYSAFNRSFPTKALSESYMNKFKNACEFVDQQSKDFESFDHYTFIKDHVNPLFALNQVFISEYKVKSKSYVDYTLTKEATSIFDKKLFKGQNSKGVFEKVNDAAVLDELEKLGELLFYDPILSGNNMRSCASCHKPSLCFADTIGAASLQFDGKNFLQRNTPSLTNATFNHLLMLDGLHISMLDQAKAVITSSIEMGGSEKEIVSKVMSCGEYKNRFTKLLIHTPKYSKVSLDHIASALTVFYSRFSNFEAPFDLAMNNRTTMDASVKKGFNIFMSKAQCATCHFAPQFNGVKPPYVGSEFEVLGVPQDPEYKSLSADKGRYFINPAKETANAFRTGTIRNADKTKPYMHNGVFRTMQELVDFYDGGGGAGHGFNVPNQTLSGDSLRLTKEEKRNLMDFISSLNENMVVEPEPGHLPQSSNKKLNKRTIGGIY